MGALLDRYLPPLLGRRRGWILIYQLCLAVAIAVMGFCSPTQAPYALGAVAVLVAFLSASQDIVVDAYRVDTIPVAERGLAAAVQSFGYRTAGTLAGAVLVLIAAQFGWRLAFIVVACLMAATTFGDRLVAGAGKSAVRHRALCWMLFGIRCALYSFRKVHGDFCCWYSSIKSEMLLL